MIDILALPSPYFTVFGEVRLHRKLSVGGIFRREQLFLQFPMGQREIGINELGGYLRYYVKGDVGTGIHLGLESLRGLGDPVPGPITLERSYALTVGYKRTLDCGRTFEVATARRYVISGDSMGLERLLSGSIEDYHVNVGWSF
jgi:hypothetical protein